MKNALIVASALAVLVCPTLVSPAWADGYEFFTVDRGRAVNLVYVGQIRDKSSGQVVREPAYFMVTEKRSGMTFPFVNDRPGHYRSPDIGESVEELAGIGGQPERPGIRAVGCRLQERQAHGRAAQEQGRGGSELQGGARGRGRPRLSRAERHSGPVDHSVQAPTTEAPAEASRSKSMRLLFMGVAGIAIIAGAAARTSGRRRSTAR